MDVRTISVITDEMTQPKPPTTASRSARQLVVVLPKLLSRTTCEPVHRASVPLCVSARLPYSRIGQDDTLIPHGIDGRNQKRHHEEEAAHDTRDLPNLMFKNARHRA